MGQMDYNSIKPQQILFLSAKNGVSENIMTPQNWTKLDHLAGFQFGLLLIYWQLKLVWFVIIHFLHQQSVLVCRPFPHRMSLCVNSKDCCADFHKQEKISTVYNKKKNTSRMKMVCSYTPCWRESTVVQAFLIKTLHYTKLCSKHKKYLLKQHMFYFLIRQCSHCDNHYTVGIIITSFMK